LLLFLKNPHLTPLPWLLNAYYLLRPAIPQLVRFSIRHLVAVPVKAACAGSWPVHLASAAAPRGWPGWPDGKTFAVVLTHDVEGFAGLNRCIQLAELEMRLGVRSAFNFVPEGTYSTPIWLREFLMSQGFEVGVHDLHHDGSLYRSRETFRRDAHKINKYLKEWDAVGFRSGFMRHDLNWLQELEVLYDSSTFDTDPFEPQPDGVATIFPFWVDRGDGTGFVELPYTLPQDSTLFLVLRERDTTIWTRKLDWIASHGGMALLNVHPDYMTFDPNPTRTQYSAERYIDFLEYLLERWSATAWIARPKDVAAYVKRLYETDRDATATRVSLDNRSMSSLGGRP